MGVWGLAPSGVQGQSAWSGGQGATPPWSWKHFSILKLLGCCFPGLFQPNTHVLLAIQVHNHRSLNDALIRGGVATLRGGGAELRCSAPVSYAPVSWAAVSSAPVSSALLSPLGLTHTLTAISPEAPVTNMIKLKSYRIKVKSYKRRLSRS